MSENQERWDLEKYKQYLSGKGTKVLEGGNRSKYGARKTKVDGHVFDSEKEANYYQELKMRLQANDIKGFCLQPIFILADGLKYKADFVVFNNDGTSEIIDVKGFKTKEYIVKKKVFEDKFNLKIKEV